MDEIDSSDIWQQILRLNILDTDSENSSVIGSSGKPAEIAADDVLNLNDDDIATLAAAIDKVEIVDTRGSMDIKPKRKRGRPKKRVIQRGKKLVPTALPDDCTETDPHPNSTLNVPLIRATISPVPEHVIQRTNMLTCGRQSAELPPTVQADNQKRKMADVAELDTMEIMNLIKTSGILNLNLQEALDAPQRHVESVNGNPHIQSWETDEANDMSMAHPKETQTWRPRGRPARKAIIKRPKLKVMESMVKSPIPQQVKSITPRPIIRATSNPVQDHHQRAIDDNVMYNPESCDISHIDDKSCTGDGEPVQHSSIMKRPRGRPNRRNVRARARQLMDESKFVANQSENVDDMCMKEHKSRSSSPSETSIHDDEYRPSPPPPPTVHSPSPEYHQIQQLNCHQRKLLLVQWPDQFSGHLHTSMVKDITEEELACFRRNNFLPHEGTCPVVPVGFIVHYSQHFFVAIFDYQRQEYPHNWCDWNGPEYWRRIAFLHGWCTGDDTDLSIMTRDWLQNGLDCGPIACSMLEQCFCSGLDANGNLPHLDLQCGHLLRIKMLRMLAGRVKLSCSDYLMLLDNPQADWQGDDMPDEDVISMIQNGRHQAQCLKLLRTLIVLSATCSMCQRPVPVQE
ncbi:hypothetical protein EDD22DRAFT_853810, partial [Suillus occidentalis]